MKNKKRSFKAIISVLLSTIIILAALPFSSVASATTLEELETKVNNHLLLYNNGRAAYTSDVYMGDVKVQPYHLNNLIYSSKTLTKSHSNISSSIDFWMYCPKTVISLYDGIKTPSFPVSTYFLLKNYVRLCGIVLTDEEALYETSSPTNYKGASNVWRAINGNTTWHQPEDAESIMLLTSKRDDYKYDLYYTRAQNAEYQVSASNTLSPRTDYIENLFNNNEYGYISSTSNDTTFQFVNRSFSDSSKIEEPVRIPLGEGATQYFIDYREIINIADKVKSDFENIKKASSHYDEDAVKNYYQAIIDLTEFNIATEFKDVNDENAASTVEKVSAKIKSIVNNYNQTLNDIGEPYIDPADAREYVTNNYTKAGVNFQAATIKFNNITVFNVYYNGSYNFGKNLVYCSPTAEKSSDIGQNYVNSWVAMPKTVVMLYDGYSESSFPVKIGFGRGASDSSYTGSNLMCVYLGGESSNNSGSASSIYSLGNSNWLVSNAIASIPKESWFSLDQINGTMPAGTIPGGGTNLSNQYGGMFNKIVLNNSLYAQNLKINPTDSKLITFYYKYYNAEYDTLPHSASIHTRQYVLNVVPLKEKLAKFESEYMAKIGTYGESTYPSDRLEAYYKAAYKLLSFNINNQFIGCSDSNAYEKTEACYNNMLAVIDEYNEAYENLQELYTVKFINYAGETVSEKQYAKNAIPTPPENTPITKISETSKFHYKYTWADMKAVTSDITYNERRATIACTLDEGTVVKKPTCTELGQKKYHCSVCNGDMYESIDIVGHDYSVYEAQYANGAKYDTSLKHDIKCAAGDETLASQVCTFELLRDGEATKIYQCKECDGLVVYTKAKYTIKFTKNNTTVIEEKEYYEDQTIVIPELPKDYTDNTGHHSFSWDIQPIAGKPTTNATYNMTDNFTYHQMSAYVYNNDATVKDVYGTETSSCSLCEYKITRACSEKHIPTEFSITGKIMLANSTTGNASDIPVANATITVNGTTKSTKTNSKGEFTLNDLEADEYVITISTNSSINRTATVSVSFEETGISATKDIGSIGLVNFDYNKDSKINTTDAALMSKTKPTKEQSKIFKSLFNKSIKYNKINL